MTWCTRHACIIFVMSCAFVAPRGVFGAGRARGATGVGFLACCFSRRHWAGEKAMVVLLFMIMCDLNLSMSHNLGLILIVNT